MLDREKIIAAMEWCRENPCKGCPYEQNKDAEGRCTISDDTIILLKEQDDYYRKLVVAWLREIALNDYADKTQMTFVDVVEEIKDRAEYGLTNYFRDVRRGENGA